MHRQTDANGGRHRLLDQINFPRPGVCGGVLHRTSFHLCYTRRHGDDHAWRETLTLVDTTSPYALTGAIFSRDRGAVREAMSVLRQSAGNLYINDKPTGAVVGQQPFGGARGSGTNDKAGSKLNLTRWVSARNIKETFSSPLDWRYPFLG